MSLEIRRLSLDFWWNYILNIPLRHLISREHFSYSIALNDRLFRKLYKCTFYTRIAVKHLTFTRAHTYYICMTYVVRTNKVIIIHNILVNYRTVVYRPVKKPCFSAIKT